MEKTAKEWSPACKERLQDWLINSTANRRNKRAKNLHDLLQASVRRKLFSYRHSFSGKSQKSMHRFFKVF